MERLGVSFLPGQNSDTPPNVTASSKRLPIRHLVRQKPTEEDARKSDNSVRGRRLTDVTENSH